MMNGVNGLPGPLGLWQEARNAEGRIYYYNTQTKATQWTKPLELMTPAEVSRLWINVYILLMLSCCREVSQISRGRSTAKMGENIGTIRRQSRALGTCRRFTSPRWLKRLSLLGRRCRKFYSGMRKNKADKLIALSNSLLVAPARSHHSLRSVIGTIMGNEWAQSASWVMVKWIPMDLEGLRMGPNKLTLTIQPSRKAKQLSSNF